MLLNINKIQIIAHNTFREIIKGKILFVSLVLGLTMATITFIAYHFTYETTLRVAVDFGLGLLNLSSIVISILIGVGLLYKEIESRTVYMIISRPVPRYAFILGKIIGLIGVLVVNIAILALITVVIIKGLGADIPNLFFWSILFTIFESTIVLLVVSTLSLVSSQAISILLSIILYITGHGIITVKNTSLYLKSESLQAIVNTYHSFLPGFYKFNIKDFVLYQESLSYSFIWSVILYGTFYGLFLTCLAMFIFERKNLD